MSLIHYNSKVVERRERQSWMNVPVQAPTPTLLERVWHGLMYTSVVVGVGVSVFILVTPAHARDVGVMNHEARVISPSISSYGTNIEQKLRADIVRDNNRFENQMQLENQRSDNQRALEADKAYYKKLEWQRKTGK